MPHNFIRFPADSPNPGRWTPSKVERIAAKHGGTLEHLWYDRSARSSPLTAYALVQGGKGGPMLEELGGNELLVLYEARGGTRRGNTE